MKITRNKDYLLAEITDEVIAFKRAEKILEHIGKVCLKLGYNKVLLDERTVNRREMNPLQVKALSHEITHTDLKKVYLAFWCKEELIDTDAKRLELFTYTNEYIIQHFSDKGEAIEWLNGTKDEIHLHARKTTSIPKDDPNKKMELIKKRDYLQLTLFVEILTPEIVSDVLKLIKEKTSHFNCNKILLDERSIKEREISPAEIMEASRISKGHGLHNVYTAVLCNENLIDKDSERFNLFTFTDEDTLQFFTKKDAATAWLNSR